MSVAEAWPYYPAFLDLEGRLAVVVGGGEAAERRARQLVRHGADVVIVSPDATEQMRMLEAEGRVTIEDRDYVRGDLASAFLVCCVSDSEEVRRAVRDEAAAEGCLLTVAGDAALGNMRVPSAIRRGKLQIAVSTSGLVPVAARHIRRRLREEFGDEWAAFVDLLSAVSSLLNERIDGPQAVRDAVLEAILESDVLERLRQGKPVSAEALFSEFSPRAVGAAAELAERERKVEGSGAERDGTAAAGAGDAPD